MLWIWMSRMYYLLGRGYKRNMNWKQILVLILGSTVGVGVSLFLLIYTILKAIVMGQGFFWYHLSRHTYNASVVIYKRLKESVIIAMEKLK